MGPDPTDFDSTDSLNLAEYFLDRRISEGKGQRIALVTPDRELTYSEVGEIANRTGGALLELGVRPGDRVILALADGPDFVGAFFGALKIGAVVVMLNPALEAEDVAAMFRFSGAVAGVFGEGPAASVAPLLGVAADSPRLLVAGGELPGHGGLEAARDAAPAELAIAPTRPHDPAIWLFSGGTTGRPKAVVQPHRSFVNTTELYAHHFLGYGPDDITLSVPKLFFGYATGSNLLFPFSVGGTAVLFPGPPTPEALFELIAAHRPTILVNVPTVIQQMLAHPAAADQDLSCLRFATSAGEPLPVPLYDRWRDLFGVDLLDGLGTAEMWHVFLSNRPGAVVPGTLGRAVPGFEVKVADEEGRELSDGEVGRLWVHGDSLALEYWQAPDLTAEAFRDGWFVGGDLVRRDETGCISYCGRGDDVLKVSGRWFVPQEVESCLASHPAVEECAVVGVRNSAGLTKPIAFVVASRPREDLEDELRRFTLERLDAYKHPRRVVVLDRFPRTHLGKIARGKLHLLMPADWA